jgi:opacity protein-like surface antigen
MLNLSDKELDRLSREAAGQYEVEEDNLSWEKLKQQLDLEIGNTPSPSPASRYRVKRVIYSFLVLLIIGIGWLVLKPAKTTVAGTKRQENNAAGSSSNPEAHAQNSANQEKAAIKTSSEGGLAGKSASPISSKPKDESSSSGQSLSEGTVNAGTDKNKIQKETNSKEKAVIAESSNDNNKKAAGAGRIKNIPNEKYLVRNNKAFGNKNIKESQTANQKSKNILNSDNLRLTKQKNRTVEKELDNSAASQIQEGKSVPGQSPNSYENNISREIKTSPVPNPEPLFGNSNTQINDASLRLITAANSSAIVVKNSGRKKSSSLDTKRPLHIGLLLAPDISNVGSTPPTKLSTTIGITLGYQLSRNLSVNTGLLYTMKNYAASGYEFQDDWWRSYLDHVVGNCNMIEIPLTLRYDFARKGKALFFVNGGFSSYLMKKESYTYYFKDQTTSDATYNTNKNYLFSMFTLSAGVEESLSKSLSIQAEPFVKLPLAGIGFGKIQLSSYGINFTLRYAPALKKLGNKKN